MTTLHSRSKVVNLTTGEERDYPFPPVFAAIAAYTQQHGIRAEHFDVALIDVSGKPGGDAKAGPRLYFTVGDWCAREDA